MSEIIFPSEVLPEIDWENPLTDNLVGLFYFDGTNVVDLVSGIIGTGTPVASGEGFTGVVQFNLSDLKFNINDPLKTTTLQAVGKMVQSSNGSGTSHVSFETPLGNYLKLWSQTSSWSLASSPKLAGAYQSAKVGNYFVETKETASLGVEISRFSVGDNDYNTTLYLNGVKSISALTAQMDSGTDTTLLKLGSTDKLNFLAVWDGSRTLQEFDEIDANPYQLFKTNETVQKEYGLTFATSAHQVTFPFTGAFTGTVTYTDGTTAPISGSGTYLLDGTVAISVAKVTATDTVNDFLWDFNQTRGDYVQDHINGAIATLIGFPVGAGYVREYGMSEGLELTTATEQVTLPLTLGYDINVTEFNGTITNYIGSGVFTLDGTVPKQVVSISGSDSVYPALFYDFTKILGNSTVVPETINGQDGTMVGFPANGVYVPERNKVLVGQELLTLSDQVTFTLTGAYTGNVIEVDGTITPVSGTGGYTLDGTIPITVASISVTDTVSTFNYDFTQEAGNTIIDTSINANHGSVVGGSLRRIYDYTGYGEIAGYQFDGTTQATLTLTGAYTGTITYTDGTILAISGSGDYIVNTGIVKSIVATDTLRSYSWDATTGDDTKIIETVSGNHAIITGASTVKWQEIVPKQVFTEFDYADIPAFHTAQNASTTHQKQYAFKGNSLGGTLTNFSKGVELIGSDDTANVTTNLTVNTTGLTQITNLTALDIDASLATADVQIKGVEANDLTG